jgi:hypothetical protein
LSTTRRLAEAEAFLNAKNVSTLSNTNNNTITIVASGLTSNTLNGLAKQAIVQQVAAQQTSTTTNNVSIQKTSSSAALVNTTNSITSSGTQQLSTLSNEKDATLIELLKRGTKVAVKRACIDNGNNNNNNNNNSTTIANINNNNNNNNNNNQIQRVVTIPASDAIVNDSTSLVLSSNGSSSPLSLTISQAASTSGISSAGSNSDIYALTYSANSSPSFLSDSDVYSVNDTAMLLQAVDSIQLLQDNSTSDQLDDIGSLSDYTSLSDSVSLNQSFTPSRQLQAVLDSPLPDSLVEFGTLNSKDYVLYGCSSSNESPATSTSPLPSPLAYPTPPASHEAIAQASPFLDDSHHFSDVSTFFHDDKKTKNFLLDDSNELFCSSGANNSNHSNNNNNNINNNHSCSNNHNHNKDNSNNLTECERILQLKNELFNDSKSVIGMHSSAATTINLFRHNKCILDEHDLFKHDNSFLNSDSKTFIGDNSAKLQDFNQNLDFLDEAQAFNIVDDDRNTSSPLSAAFFTSMSTAEEVKEALEEVLPNEDDGAGSTLDLYFLSAGLSLQSQMMSTSDDPLLSSVPRDFGNQRQPTITTSSSNAAGNNNNNNANNIIISSNNNHQVSHATPSFDNIDPFAPPGNKRIKTELIESSDNSDNNNKNLLSVQTEHTILTKDNTVFLSPSSISSSSAGSSPKLQNALLSYSSSQMPCVTATSGNNLMMFKSKQKSCEIVIKKHEQFKSRMKKTSQLHYTPSPLLNPDRSGNGLYTTIPIDRLNDFDDTDDDDVDMMDFFEKPRVNIGTDYQAIIPNEINNNNNDKKPCETLLWKPSVLDDDRQLDRYIDLAKSSAVPMRIHSIESALKILMESQGEVHVAVLKLLQSNDKSAEKQSWTQTEMEQFLKGLEKHGKDFTSIARDILNKTTGDCVQLYYFWKKLCNEYKSTHLPQPQQHHHHQYQQQQLQINAQQSRECNFIGNDNKHNNNSDDFFDYVDSHHLSNSTIQNGIGHNNNSAAAANHNNNNNNNNSELRPHVCEVPDCSAVS